MLRRVTSQAAARVSTKEDQSDIETEVERRAAAQQMITQRAEKEMRRISSPERTRCGLLGCIPRRATPANRATVSMEQRVFGSAVKATPAETKLNEVITQLQSLLAEQEGKVDRARAAARAAYKPGQDAKQNKEAVMALKRVKQLEKQLEGLHGQLIMVERQRDSLEESQMQKKLVAALSQSAKVMKANGPLVKKAEQVADAAVELFDQNDDIANALAQVADDGDDDELLEELAQMTTADEAIETALEISDTKTPFSLHAAVPVPTGAPKIIERTLERTSLLASA